MTITATPAAPSAAAVPTATDRADRPADITKPVKEWKGEPKITAMVSRTSGEPKYERIAIVEGKKPADGTPAPLVPVSVVGSLKQFESSNGFEIEGYLSADKTLIYWQPKLSGASSASQFM